jgi:integrator complex subunit 11
MSEIRVVPLGAGQDVGRSCILVTLNGKTIMFDCGMHMGYNDARRFPDFSYISKTGQFTQQIDLVVISHFHLDHCGALPHFTEVCGYDGPIVMTHPTKAICPILLQDYRKIMTERRGETDFFTVEDIERCMNKVHGVNLREQLEISPGFTVQPYYAGHVIGAAMFLVRVDGQSCVYTGDYNMTPDRHLGAAWMDRVRPDLLITESTYATTVRDSKRAREQAFLQSIKATVQAGGKVLIPVFALGRAQELCILIDSFWTRQNLTVPIYFAQGLTTKANEYYRLYVSWTNEQIRESFERGNKFDFKNIEKFDRDFIQRPGPMVVFATPGMLHAGLALEIFKAWSADPANLLILPGRFCFVLFCVCVFFFPITFASVNNS